jgi:CheY-like chemotaxis protein
MTALSAARFGRGHPADARATVSDRMKHFKLEEVNATMARALQPFVILLVEDEFLIRMWVEEALQDAGHQVIAAGTADEAMRILERRHDVELMFTDIDMPGSMDGLGLASVVRDRWPPIHVVIASGKHRPQRHEMPAQSVFLPKPYLPDDIVGVIRGFRGANSP